MVSITRGELVQALDSQGPTLALEDSHNESTIQSWGPISEQSALFYDNLVRLYEPVTPNPRSSLGGAGPMMKWIDPCEVPKSSLGEVAAVQLSRTPSGFGTAARGAKCCLRTPRPHLKQGGDWRKTFVKLVVPHPSHPDDLWYCSLKVWNWATMKSPQGPLPFPAFQIRWIITVFITVLQSIMWLLSLHCF